MEFNSGYVMAMDRDYGEGHVYDSSTNDVGISPIRDIGMSVPFGIAAQNVQGVAAKIRTGARIIELQFPGAGRSNRQSQTPEMYGKLQREALEELSRANNVDFTTHASFGVFGLAGMDQQGNFSKLNKRFAIDEIRRAIDFAADVARGGNVTVHTGEFQRPISEEPWALDKAGKHLFKNYAEEPERAIYRVVDERSGQVILQARKNQKVARAIWLKAKPGETYTDDDGNQHMAREGENIYINYDNQKVAMENRVPEFDAEKQRFKVDYWDWSRFEKEAIERTQEAREFWRKHKNNPQAWERSSYYQFRNVESEKDITILPEEAYVQASLETNAANARGWALYYGQNIEELRADLLRLRKALETYEHLEKTAPEDAKEFLQKEVSGVSQRYKAASLIPSRLEYPTEIIKDAINEINKSIEYSRQTALSQEQQAADTFEQMRYIQSHRRYGLGEAYGAYAEAGMHAMVKSDELQKRGKLKQPIFVAMENIFPENYGGHPDELIDLVKGARRAMVDQLKQRGYNEEKARKEAEEHLKGHLDTGHLNMWRKYWIWNEKISPEENDRKFNEWALGRVQKLADEKIIGSVHLTDNLGYQDEHLSPGQGNTPTVEIIRILKKSGYNGPLIVEPGADATTDNSDFHGVMKAWRLFGSSIYGMGGSGQQPGRQRQWSDVQYSYFGKSEPPYFVFGRYSPSEDWTLWSGVPME